MTSALNWGILVRICAVVATSAALSDAEPPKATCTAQQLRAGLLATAEKIKSLSVVYESEAYAPEFSPPGTYLHREVVVKSPCSLHHVSAHGHATLDWQDDPYQQRAYVSEDHFFNEFPVNRKYSEGHLEPADGLPGTLADEFFFRATGIWPLERRRAPRPLGGPYMLREVAKGEEFSSVRPRQELVDGRWCHVLEWPGKDRLWLDTERGCALLQRETVSSRQDVLAQRIELGGHTEAAPGIWLPHWVVNIQFDYEAPTEEGRHRKVIDARHNILRAEVNQVDDRAFVFRPKPGSLTNDKTGPLPVQAQAGGLDHLANLEKWLRKYAPSRWPRARASAPLGAVLFVPTAIFIALCEVQRRKAARRRLATKAAIGVGGGIS
jgi:hypothetical protein